ncbi:MAG: IPT/TIG domain-containing protein [Armatimonadota bacterium]
MMKKLKNIKQRYLLRLCAAVIILCFVFSLSAGCSSNTADTLPGSENSIASASVDGTVLYGEGDVRVKVYWPEKEIKSKLIPSNTQHILITISGQGLTTDREAQIPYGTTEATIENLPAGNKTAEIQAVAGSGSILAHRFVDFVISSGQTTDVSAILGVSITADGYIPQNITISPNDTLYWINSDSAANHQIISVGGKFTNSGNLAYGQSYNYQFTTANTCEYYDNADPSIRGNVIVKASPYIDSISPSSGTIGTSVTINGGNFGSSQGTSTVTFNGVTATSISSWGNTQITCTVPTYSTTGTVIVTVAGQASNAQSFTMSIPSISGLSVDNGAIGTSVTINGNYFGSTQGTSKVTFNGITASITSWGNTQIICTVPDATTGNVVVTVSGNASNGVAFTVNNSWSAQASAITGDVRSIIFTDANNGWAAGLQYCVRTTNGGTDWTTVYDLGGGTTLYTISALNNMRAWTAGSPTNCYYTTDGGSSWTGVWFNTSSASSVFMINENIGWMSCGWEYGQTVKKTSNGGASWSNIYDAGAYRIKSIHAENANQVWMVGTGGRILYSLDGGSSRAVQTSGTANNLWSVFFTDTSNGWAVGDSGTILHTSNGGSSWSAQTSGTAQHLYGVCFVDSDWGWACGANGTILYTSNGGTNWSAQTSGTAQHLYGINFVDVTHGWCCGASGTILYYH